jgi:hypothetical protein
MQRSHEAQPVSLEFERNDEGERAAATKGYLAMRAATRESPFEGMIRMVERGWMGMFDWPEFWNSKVRAADCLNPQAARSILPIADLRARMVMAGRSKAEIVSA